jgi:4-hydroxymandelate oxidase
VNRRDLLKISAIGGAASIVGEDVSASLPNQGQATCGPPVNEILSLPEFEEHAKRCMSHMSYEYVASAAADEITLRWNREAYDQIRLRPRILQEVATVDTMTTLLGQAMPFPILLAPTAYHRAIHPDGELATARGAGAAGATWVVSTATTTPLDEIASVAKAPLWFQLYVQPDKGVTLDLVRRAEAVGCKALCLTVDTPVQGARNRQTKAKFALPPGVTAPYMTQLASGGRAVADNRRGVAVTWKDVEWLKANARIPVLLKGVITGADADLGVAAGAAGIIVSNHGARVLDTLPATISALPEVVGAVQGRVPILVDGGIRRGTDVLKALAMGANAVLIGRPYCFGLAVGGAAGVQRAIEILKTEFEMAMQLTGQRSLEDISPRVLWTSPG